MGLNEAAGLKLVTARGRHDRIDQTELDRLIAVAENLADRSTR
jgi:hypothetical protein